MMVLRGRGKFGSDHRVDTISFTHESQIQG